MPYNIPSNDPGVVLVPGQIETFCEWLVTLAGGIATCVESSEMVVDHLVKSGFPCTAAEDTALAQDLISRGDASPNGATNYLAASAQMTRLGIPNDAYGQSWFAANDFVSMVQAALKRGIPVLFGLSEAHYLHDDWTNSAEDGGVYGHGIAIIGMDSTGAICADPNTSQAKYGQFVHYTWADLKQAGGAWPSMVIPRGSMKLDISQTLGLFTQQADGSWLCKEATKLPSQGAGAEKQHSLAMGLLAFYQTVPAAGTLNGLTALGLPLSDPIFNPDGVAGLSLQLFERGGIMYDPQRKWDNPAGATGDCYVVHMDDPRVAAFYYGTTGSDSAEVAQLKAEVTQLQSQIATLQQTQVPADTHTTLASVAQLLTPLAQASADVTHLMKELGY